MAAETSELLADGLPAAGALQFEVTRAVIDEALRLAPPLPVLARASGTLSLWALQRPGDLDPAADVYDPDRWLDPQLRRPETCPFGGGDRACPVAAMARDHLTLLTAMIVRAVELAPARSLWPVRPRLGLALRDPRGLPVQVRRRESVAT